MRNWIDLTHKMDAGMPIYADGSYSDPEFAAVPWSRVATDGFAVWHLHLGTQTGTHIDAPCHFREDAPDLDALDPGDCVGRYFYVTSAELAGEAELGADRYSGETMLFLDARDGVEAPKSVLERLLILPASVWIMAGVLTARDPDPFWLNRALADAGRFLVEDLNLSEINRVKMRGEAIAMPLRLTGLSGSPVRVLVRAATDNAPTE